MEQLHGTPTRPVVFGLAIRYARSMASITSREELAMFAQLYISSHNGKIDTVSVDIYERKFALKPVHSVSTGLITSRKKAEQFLHEQVQQYKYENDAEFDPQFRLIESKLNGSDQPLLID